jgi:cytochrome c oxidase cbb3-type subunit 3
MIAWQSQLNPKQMQEVASYVISLHGTKPANPKQPEGTIWKDSTVTTAAN